MYSTHKGLTQAELEAKEAEEPGYRARLTEERKARAAQRARSKKATKDLPMGTREELLYAARRGNTYAIKQADGIFENWR